MPPENPTSALDKSLIAQLIARATSRPEAVRAYEHENGFEKVTLGRDPVTGALLRAHFWSRVGSAEQARPAGNLHNHRWDFASMVLRGGLRIARFVESLEGEPFTHYRYWPDRGDALEFIGHSRLLTDAHELYGVGDKYHEPADEVHHASPVPGTDTVTVMARSGSRRTYADVYTKEARPDMVDDVSPLSVDRIRQLLSELNDLVGTPPSAQQ